MTKRTFRTNLNAANLSSLGPSWKINLLVIGALIFIVIAYSICQIGLLRKNFKNYSKEHSRVVSGVIEQNTRTAGLAEDALKQTIKTFLENTARFVDYLDSVEPFSTDELEAFAGETGLAAIRILDDKHEPSESMVSLLPNLSCRETEATLDYFPEKQLYVMVWPRPEESCIILGFSAAHIEKLHKQLRMPALLHSLSALPGIKYVRLLEEESANIALDKQTVEQHIRAGDTVLRVGFDTSRYTMRVKQVWRNMLIFSILLVLLGIFFSWLLYRYQRTYLLKMTDFERKLAKEREDAALGRATATITHEIRNPLNAISMGLQRIELEADELDKEHRELAATMRKAVRRTNTIIGDLLRYSRPITTKPGPVDIHGLIGDILILYKPQCEKQQLKISHDSSHRVLLQADSELLGQLVENLIKNSVEAQKTGGYIRINSLTEGKNVVIVFENGTNGTTEEPTQLLEPYFTTKTRGTGLGLPMARRIAEAHGGFLQLESPEKNIFRVLLSLPVQDE